MKTHMCLTTRFIVAALLLLRAASVTQAENKPIAHWLFAEKHFAQSAAPDTVHGYKAQVHGTVDFLADPLAAVRFDGEGGFLSIDDPPRALLPEKTITAEAWVRLNAGQDWGNLVGYFQDNGSYEKGWLLGYNSTKFTFSVSTRGKLQYLPGQTQFHPDRWYHVAGTYDGSMLRLYVNGKLENSQALRGAIDYPDKAVFAMGAYKDDDEFFPMNGALHEVAIYGQALSEKEIRAKYDAKAPAESVPLEVELGPYVQYISPSQAVVRWRTKEACSSILEYGLAGPGAKYSPSIRLYGGHRGKLETRLEHPRPKKRHAMTIRNLRPNDVYAYRVGARQGDTERSSEIYELDTALNYSVRPLPQEVRLTEDDTHHERMRAVARDILSRTGVTKGYCLVWGLADGTLAHALAAGSDLTVLGVDEDTGRIAEIRSRLYKAGVYGRRISIQSVDSLADVPYPGNFANLIVSERMLLEGDCPGEAAEMARVLRPRGGVAVLGCLTKSEKPIAAIEDWLGEASLTQRSWQTANAIFRTVTKPLPPGIGSWTHQYGDTGNTADSHDELGGATGTDQLRIQWLGKPGADFGMDRNPRMPAPLASGGRLFHQGMNRMVALDAYNGAILWSLEIPALQRVNLPRDAGNWCTDDASLYVAIEDKCWMIEHYHGNVQRVLELPGVFPGDDYDWGYVARKDGLLFGSAVRKNTIYTDFWGGASWYDKTAGAGTEKVCSDALFACDVRTQKPIWTWHNGLIINTTIAVGERAVFFVESRNEQLKESPNRRLNDARLWLDQYLVALDPQTGTPRWEVPLDTADGIVVFFLACRDDAILIASSAAGKYHLYKFDANDGRQLWHAEHKWPSDNHGGHMQHPVVLADKVFLEPCGYDFKTGERITSAMSGREGCATYCGTKHALIHRGQARRITLWDFTTGRITSWHNLRPSCWLSTVAGEGMVLSPEGGGGCSCGNWLETSLAFAPVEDAADAISTE